MNSSPPPLIRQSTSTNNVAERHQETISCGPRTAVSTPRIPQQLHDCDRIDLRVMNCWMLISIVVCQCIGQRVWAMYGSVVVYRPTGMRLRFYVVGAAGACHLL